MASPSCSLTLTQLCLCKLLAEMIAEFSLKSKSIAYPRFKTFLGFNEINCLETVWYFARCLSTRWFRERKRFSLAYKKCSLRSHTV
ncbi:hypothetical protein CP8484711_0713A, partial [Chlamydia psittaci 84-8471/1]